MGYKAKTVMVMRPIANSRLPDSFKENRCGEKMYRI